MRKPINFWTERDKRHREPYRLAQAQTMLDLFVKARGGSPETAEELGQFLEEERRLGGVPAGPIRPTPKAIAKGRTESPLRRPSARGTIGHERPRHCQSPQAPCGMAMICSLTMRREPNEMAQHFGQLGQQRQKTWNFNVQKTMWRSRQGLNPQPPRSKRGTLSS